MKNNITKNRGFIKTIIIIVIAIAILSYYKIDLRDIFTSDQFHANLNYVWDFIVRIWNWLVDLFTSLINLIF